MVEARGQGPHLAVSADPRTRSQRRVGEPVCGKHLRLAAFCENHSGAASADVVCTAFDRQGLEVRIAEHRCSRGDVLEEQLILQQPGSCRDHDRVANPARGALHRKGDRSRQIRE